MNPQEEDSEVSSDLIYILEIVNFCFIVGFLGIFACRLISLNHLGQTQEHINKYPKSRIIVAFIYIVCSIVFFFVNLFTRDHKIDMIFDGGVGECLNSMILCIHMAVLKQQLKKEQTYTRFHMIYMVYLAIISLARLVISIFDAVNSIKKKIPNQVLAVISGIMFINSLALLFMWIKKRKQLPDFLQNTNQNLSNISHPISVRTYDINRLSTNFCKTIYPTVMVEKGKIRIVLQSMASNNILSTLQPNEKTLRSTKQIVDHRPVSTSDNLNSRRLEIISNRLYNIEEIQRIYIEAHRFNIQTRVSFVDCKMGKLYQDFRKFLDELFQIKKSYVPEILEMFHIEKDDIQEITTQVKKKCFTESELEACEQRDSNAMFVSVKIFKNFWVHNHYIFYMHIKPIDQHDKSTIYKRYNDFEEFHKTIRKILTKNHMSSYKLPTLPKKILFHSEEEVQNRQRDLENYCSEIVNDHYLMQNLPGVKEYILDFLGLRKTISIVPLEHKFRQYFNGMSIKKGNIMQNFMKDQYVTFYEFFVYRNGNYSHRIHRRFQEFVHLDQSLTRWMDNIQITYKFLTLPDKILFKSQSDRQQKLLKYLECLIQIKDIYKVYAASRFLNVGSDDGSNISNISNWGMSIIKRASIVEDEQQNLYSRRSYSRHGSNISELIQDLNID